MRYAVIKTGGKQYKVEEGQVVTIEKIESDQEKIEFGDILLLVDDGKAEIGKPTLKAKVIGEILEQSKGEKIKVFKFKAKTRYRKLKGHRQKLTKVKIDKIVS